MKLTAFKEKFRKYYVPLSDVMFPYSMFHKILSNRFNREKPLLFDDRLKGAVDVLYTVVSFNNSLVIEKQIKLLKKFSAENFDYMVFDNSTDSDAAEEIRKMCNKNDVSYLRLPENPCNSVKSHFYGASSSHAMSINYAFYNYVKHSNYKYWVLLDHDIFPLYKFSINEYLNGFDSAGFCREGKRKLFSVKYLWPGFCFMKIDWAKKQRIDFFIDVRRNGDTGAKNAKPLSRAKVNYLNKLTATVGDFERGGYTDNVGLFECGWMHIRHLSNYFNIDSDIHNKKVKVIMDIVDSLIGDTRTITREEFADFYRIKNIS